MKSDFHERKEARIERLRAAAATKLSESEKAFKQVNALGDLMNGQPILIGHHSEKRHRRDLDKMHNKMSQSVQADKDAKSYLEAAQAAEDNRAILGDDPDALFKLKAKLTALVNAQEGMVKVNALLRKAAKLPELAAKIDFIAKEMNVSHDNALEILTPGKFDRSPGYPRWRLANNNKNIATVKQRIEKLEKYAAIPDTETKFGEVVVKALTSENRVQIIFPGKPSEILRNSMKSDGFRWSPTNGAWQAFYSLRAVKNAERHAMDFGILQDQTDQLP